MVLFEDFRLQIGLFLVHEEAPRWCPNRGAAGPKLKASPVGPLWNPNEADGRRALDGAQRRKGRLADVFPCKSTVFRAPGHRAGTVRAMVDSPARD
jgi:hypothetical protein